MSLKGIKDTVDSLLPVVIIKKLQKEDKENMGDITQKRLVLSFSRCITYMYLSRYSTILNKYESNK